MTTKQWRGFHGYDETMKSVFFKTFPRFCRCIKQSASRLDGRIDLLLMHWPGPGYSAMGRSKAKIEAEGIQCYFKKGHEDMEKVRLETWRAMEDAVEAGLCKSIGVSNFSASHVRKLLAWPQLRIKPVVNQIEIHPYHQQRELVALCKSEGIVVQATFFPQERSPLGLCFPRRPGHFQQALDRARYHPPFVVKQDL